MFTLEEVVPWGRSFGEYARMFELTGADRQRRILGCGDGPASFNAEATELGWSVVSCDPLYRYGAGQIRGRVEATYPVVIAQTRQNAADFLWGGDVPDVEALGRLRLGAMERFLADFEAGRSAGRYVCAGLPRLPLRDDAFDLALCSHFLFLYSRQHDAEFHVAAVRELARVAAEVRVFPLVELGGAPSRHVEAVLRRLQDAGLAAVTCRVGYEFQRGGNEMLRVRRRG